MNRITRTYAAMRERMSDSLMHIGWGFFGQQCDCNNAWPDMNWLAKRTDKFWDDFDEEKNRCRSWRGRMCMSIGSLFCRMGTRLINGQLMTDYYAEQRVLDIKADAIEGAMREAAANAKDVTPKKRRKRRNKKNVRLTRIQQVELHAMWKQGSTIAACARRFRVSYPTARKYINIIEDEAITEMFVNERLGLVQ